MYNDEFHQYHYNRDDLPRDEYQRSYQYSQQYSQPPQQTPPVKKGFFRKTGTRIVALVLLCALIGGGCGYAGAALYRRSNTSTAVLQQSDRQDVKVELQQVSGVQEMTPAEVYAAAVNSVVSINTSTAGYNIFGQQVESSSSGSGFIITADGYIVTNQHVVSGASSVNVTLYDGKTYTADVIGGDSDYDVAVIKIDAKGLTPVTMGRSDEVNVGDTVLAIGNPLGELTFSMTQGIVSCCDRAINVDGTPFNMIQVDASINPGNSGGPLMNTYGEVVGIVSAKYSTYSSTTVEGLGFAIPINDVQAVITDIIENGSVTGKAYMGITAGSMTEQMAAQYKIDLTTGVFVYSVEEDGAGDKAGLQLGDVITKINDTEIETYNDLTGVKKNYRAGDTVTLTVYRDGKYITAELTFDEQPEETEEEESAETPYNSNRSNPSMEELYRYFFGGYGN